MPGQVFGRDAELTVLAAFLRGLPGGPGALVLSGPAGAGKTTLLRAAVAEATALGMTVLATQPAGSDVRLAFTGLSDLLGPELDALLPRLPPPQRRALSVALQVQDAPGRPPEPIAIAVAVRTALAVLAAVAPVLVAVDDVQWLDPPSRAAVSFALRRLVAEPVGLLGALRAAGGEPELPLELDRARLPAELVPLGGLSPGALHRMLRSRLGVSFSHPTLRRIEAESAGNPFIALEIGRALARRGMTRLAGRDLPIPDPPACPARTWTMRSPPGCWRRPRGGWCSPIRCWPRRWLGRSRRPGAGPCTPWRRPAPPGSRSGPGTVRWPRRARMRRPRTSWPARGRRPRPVVPRPPPPSCLSCPPG